jgi:hypothetical protein
MSNPRIVSPSARRNIVGPVTGLWSEQAVGIGGNEPKYCKSFPALDLAVAVAAGVPCLRRFAVPRADRAQLLHCPARSGSRPPQPRRDRRQIAAACSSSIRSYISIASTRTPAAKIVPLLACAAEIKIRVA